MTLYYFIVGLIIKAVYAAQTPISQYCAPLHPGCGAGSAFIFQLSYRVIDVVSILIGGSAVFMVMYGGIKLIISGGNEEGKTQAKNIITAALIGLFLAIMGKAFVEFTADFVISVTPDNL